MSPRQLTKISCRGLFSCLEELVMSLHLDYYYGAEAEQYSFYRVPKTLLTDPRYKLQGRFH